MRAGKLRHRVVFKRLNAAKNSSTGVVTQTWVEFKALWASIDPLSAKEYSQADETQSKISARITIRFYQGILPSMRIYHRDNVYKIEGILPDRKSGREYLTLPCSEIARG